MPDAATHITARALPLIDATAETVAAFGQILGAHAGAAPLPIDFYGGAVEVRKPVAFASDDDTELTVCTIQPRPAEVTWMERHFKHTQTFIPLGGKPFIAVMAPPTDTDLPDLDQAVALRFDGSAGFTMHVGTWHEFPFALEADSDVIVILRGEATRDLMTDRVIADEARGPDVDKKNIIRRMGTRLTFAT